MIYRYFSLMVCALCLLLTVGTAHGDTLVYYDIAHATATSLPLAPVYVTNSDSSMTASSLTEHGLYPAWACCQDGTGELSFSGWGTGGSGGPGPAIAGDPTGRAWLQIALTADVGSLDLSALDFTWFSTLNSDLFNGPDGLAIFGSFNDFATDSFRISYRVPGFNHPGEFTYPATSIDLSGLRVFQGDTLTVRFVAFSTQAFWDAGAGFWNIYSNNVNLAVEGTLDASPTPEPGSLGLSAAALGAMFWLKRYRAVWLWLRTPWWI